MKIDGQVILLTSFRDARLVAYAPIEYEHPMGSSPGRYAARLAGVPERRCDDFTIDVNQEVISRYFQLLIDHETHHQLANIDFNLGRELDVSWWGSGAHCIARQDWSDSRPLDYLHVLQHIIDLGYEAFEFEFFDDHYRLTESCKVIKKSSQTPFVIERIIDPNLFDGLVSHLETLEQLKNRTLTACTALDFIAS